MLNLMIDLETLGTAVDTIVLTVGAVVFDETRILHGHDLEVRLDIDEQVALGRTMTGDTLRWWLEQSTWAQKALFNPSLPVFSIADLHSQLAGRVMLLGVDRVWAHGSSFDIAILDHMFRKTGSPWRYSFVRDDRTLLDMMPADFDKPEADGTIHNALADATNQARVVIAARAYLKRVHA